MVSVLRIVANTPTPDPSSAQLKLFYGQILNLDILMDHGWITIYGSRDQTHTVQLSFASEGGSGTPVPDLSIEVDDVQRAHDLMNEAGFEIKYPLTAEPWGVRRFYVRDPCGRLVNILAHVQ